MKTYLAECNLNVTSPDGESSKILVSDPEENKMRASFPCEDDIYSEVFKSTLHHCNLLIYCLGCNFTEFRHG